MKTNMYFIYDTKKEVYEGPFFADSIGSMERAIYNEFKEQKSDLSKYPADMILFYSGLLDRDEGIIEMIPHLNCGVILDICIRHRREEKTQQMEFMRDENEISDGSSVQPGANSIDSKESI